MKTQTKTEQIIREQLISFKTAKLAKEKGYTDNSYYWWQPPEGILSSNNMPNGGFGISAPTQALLQWWLREKHNIHLTIDFGINGYYCYMKVQEPGKLENREKSRWINTEDFPIKTYEDALEKGLPEALKLINNENPN